MIKGNELKVGNWVQRRGKALQVVGIMDPIIRATYEGLKSDYVVFDDQLHYIPISPEILEKAGFKESRQTFFTWYTRRLVENHFRLDYSDQTTYHWVQGNTIVELNYLHQLQNLYFVLTATELEINL